MQIILSFSNLLDNFHSCGSMSCTCRWSQYETWSWSSVKQRYSMSVSAFAVAAIVWSKIIASLISIIVYITIIRRQQIMTYESPARWKGTCLKKIPSCVWLTVTGVFISREQLCLADEKVIWAAAWQNQQNDLCAQRRLRSAWAATQSDQSSQSAWRNFGSLATQP